MKTNVFKDCIQADGTEILKELKRTELLKAKFGSATSKNDKRYFAVDNDTGEFNFNCYRKGKLEPITKIDYVHANVCITFRGPQIELVFYDKPLTVPKHVAVDDEIMASNYTFPEIETVITTRNWEMKDDILVPVKDGVNLTDLVESIGRSAKKSLHNFYNLAIANKWEYFCTFTFAEKEIRLTRELLFSEWRNFLRMLRKRSSAVKALGIYERYKKDESGFHFHFLLGDVDLYLKPGRNPHENNEFMYTDFGHQMFNCVDWKNGHNTVVCIRPDATQLQVVNYMSKYMTKSSPAPYGCKRYLCTQNLDRSFSWVGFVEKEELKEFLKHYDFRKQPKKRKSTNGAIYYTYTMEDKNGID